jgi:polyisoprenoid-binding protein YceI
MSTTRSDEIRLPATRRWAVDAARSTVAFSVRTFWGLGKIEGRFERFDGSYLRGPGGGEIELTVDVRSVDTGNARRDAQLRAADLLDDYPEVRFTSTRVVESRAGVLHVAGNLVAGGETLPLAFDAPIRDLGDELEIDGTATADDIRLGSIPGPLRMIRPPATLHVRLRLI